MAAIDGGTSYATTYTYGDAELASAMSSAAVQSGSTSWTYDSGGRLATESDPNSQTITWSFNPDNTLQSQTLKNSSNTTLASWSYLYDGDYRKTQQAFSGQSASPGSAVTATFTYSYDSANRLHTWVNGSQTTTYSWDHDGNRTQVAGTTTANFIYNADDSINTVSGVSHAFTYSGAGDLTCDGALTYSYDGFDRVSSVAPANSNCGAGTTSASYKYDGLDRQMSHTEGSSTTSLHYQSLSTSVAMETSSSGTNTVYELSPSGKPRGLTQETGTPTTQYLTDDGARNVTTATSTSQGVVCTVRYDPFGTALSPQSTTNPCSSGSTLDSYFYRGGRRDSTTGQYQFGSRTYDPSKASFLIPDSYRSGTSDAALSVGTDPFTQDTYAYVNGDPINLSDPTGHSFTTDEGGPTYTPCEIRGTCNSPPPNQLAAAAPSRPTRPWNDYNADPSLTDWQAQTLNGFELNGMSFGDLSKWYFDFQNQNIQAAIACEEHQTHSCNPAVIDLPGDVSAGDVAAVASLLIPGAEELGAAKLGADIAGDLSEAGLAALRGGEDALRVAQEGADVARGGSDLAGGVTRSGGGEEASVGRVSTDLRPVEINRPGDAFGYGGGRITVDQARAAAERNGIDTRMFDVQEAGPSPIGNKGGVLVSGTPGAQVLERSATGQFILKLYDQGLVDEQTAVGTFAHELNHVRGVLGPSGTSTLEDTAELSALQAEVYFVP